MEHSMDDVVETVKKAKDRGKKCTLLIGEGAISSQSMLIKRELTGRTSPSRD